MPVRSKYCFHTHAETAFGLGCTKLKKERKKGQLERDSEGQEKIIDLVFCLLGSIFFKVVFMKMYF